MALRNQSSKTFMFLYRFPIDPMLKAISQAKIMTGIPVAIANDMGKNKPPTLVTVMGINIPKYNTPLYGQKARANTIPNKSTPQKPRFFRSSIFAVRNPVPGICNLSMPSINKPIIINSGPMSFSPHTCRTPEILN